MVKKYDIITMGSALVDAFVDVKAPETKGRIWFEAGAKIKVPNISFAVGGGSTNTAACFSGLGLKVGFLGKIGSGYNSGIIKRELGKNGVDFVGVESKEHAGYSIILDSVKKNRTILTYKGASDTLKYSEIDFKKLNSKWFYFTSMAEKSFECQKKLSEYAKRNGINLAFNPSSYHTKRGARHLSKILKNTEVLILNFQEAKMLVKRGNLFKGLRKLGARFVCVTNGRKEGGVYDGEFLYRFFPNKVKVEEVTGAGDAFGSSFIVGLIKLGEVEGAVRVAMANAESVIQKKGAQEGLLSWNGVLRDLKRKKFRVERVSL